MKSFLKSQYVERWSHSLTRNYYKLHPHATLCRDQQLREGADATTQLPCDQATPRYHCPTMEVSMTAYTLQTPEIHICLSDGLSHERASQDARARARPTHL